MKLTDDNILQANINRTKQYVRDYGGKVSTLPTATSSNVGQIYQYTGSTTPTYTHGYFYECKENSGTYAWVNVPVGEGSGDVSDSTTTITTSTATYPDFSAGETLKVIFGKIKKFLSDLHDKKADFDDVETALDGKVDKVTGKSLSTNDYSDTDKAIVDGVTSALALKADKSEIPTKTSDLTNDNGFITNTVNNLVNYYTKTQTYTQAEVDALISSIVSLNIKVVATLPTTNISTTTIYLVPSADPQTQNVKDEYINIDGTTTGWERIGSTAIDLSDYVTNEDLTTALAGYTTTANLNTLLAAKQNVISDLATIRSGASAGATAYQKPSTGIPKTDLANGVQTSLGKADSAIQDISGKADKVSSATNNHFAALDANGNLKDSGHKHSDYLTQHQDISGKADKVSGATSGNVATLDANGNLTDSGMTIGKSVPSTAKFSDSSVGQYNTVDSNDYRILLSYSANDDAETKVARKSSKLKFNHDTGNLQVPKLNGVTVGSSPKFTDTDTKNTAGSTDSSSKLFLIGATSQAANPQTYSQDTAYVGTDGNLYSGSKVVATQNMIGDAWVASHAYAVGDYCIDGNVLYKCKTAHTSSASYRPPYASYWDAVSVASELGAKYGQIRYQTVSGSATFSDGSGFVTVATFIPEFTGTCFVFGTATLFISGSNPSSPGRIQTSVQIDCNASGNNGSIIGGSYDVWTKEEPGHSFILGRVTGIVINNVKGVSRTVKMHGGSASGSSYPSYSHSVSLTLVYFD